MKAKLVVLFILSLCSFSSSAQITGSDTVCAGVIYIYTANIPGSVTYTWTVPSNWYNMTGQGTSQITVSCNTNAGQVCVEGFDSIGSSMGNQCKTAVLGSAGGGNWTLWPSGINPVCDFYPPAHITPVMTFQGGGGCPQSCGSGISNPNVLWALYQGQIYVGAIGTSMFLGWGTYHAALVDTTLGSNFPQAIEIIGGCGGGSGSFSIGPIGLIPPSVTQTPSQACVGDTITLEGCCGGWNPVWPYGPWYNNTGLILITPNLWTSQIQAIVTSVNASVYYSISLQIQVGFNDGSYCDASTVFNVNAIYCNTITSFQAAATTICENSCIDFTNLSLHATNYSWSFPGATPATSTDTNPSNICYSSPGSYDVMLVSSNALYSDTLFLPGYITVTSPPQASFTPSQTNFCPPDCIDFINTSSNATSYQWSFPGAVPVLDSTTNPQNICYNSSGLFDVTLISSNAGCSDSLNVTGIIAVNPSPQSSMQANPVNLCPGSCTSFTNTSIDATSCQWNFFGAVVDTSTLISPSNMCYNSTGQYDVLLINYNGLCYDTLFSPGYITVYPQPLPPVVTQNNDTLTATPGFASYQWYYNGNSIPGASDYFYVATQSGDYNLIATDTNGCEVEVVNNDVIASIQSPVDPPKDGSDVADNKQLAIFPNPVSGYLSITNYSLAGTATTEISIFNVLGEKIYSDPNLQSLTVDCESFPPGIYFLEIKASDKIFNSKFVKQ